MGFKNKTKLGFIMVFPTLLAAIGSLYLSTFIPQLIVSKNKAYSMPIKV